MKRIVLFPLFFLLLSMSYAIAQDRVISGEIYSEEDQQPIIGATIFVKGTKTGTYSDVDGKFTLKNLPASAKELEISSIGMITQVVPIVYDGKILKIMLKSNAEVLGAVVVTGLQKMDKRLFTGASDKLDAAKVKLDGAADISRSLEGRSAGVSVQNVSGTFGTAPKIRVRGATSIYGNSKPLWVVDGVIMEGVADVSADNLSSGDAVTLISSAISGLNTDDIESFQILKDGSATSIYGAKAMAGVIVITTKRGKQGSNRISYTGEFTTRLKPRYSEFNIMNSQEQMGVFRSMESSGLLNLASVFRYQNSGVYGKMYQLINTYDPYTKFSVLNTPEGREEYLRQAEYRNTDWFDLLFKNSVSQNHSVSMTSGNDKASYYTSLSIMNDPGWTLQSKVQRYTFNINALYNLSKSLSFNVIGNASYRKQRAPGTLAASTDISGEVSRSFDINPYSFALNTSRTLDPKEYYTRNYAPFNIFTELDNNYIDIDLVDTRFQGEFKYKPISKVELSALAAYKYSTSTQNQYMTERSNLAMAYRAMGDAFIINSNSFLYPDPDIENAVPESVIPSGGILSNSQYKMNSYDLRLTASYNDVYNNDHILNLFGGMELNATDRFYSGFDAIGVQFDAGYNSAFNYKYFKQLREENGTYYGFSDSKTRDLAYFATATYSYKGRYTLNGTARYEGSNKLGRSLKARWLPTWNISTAWNVHEEPWFEYLRPAMSNLTFKASYSLTADRGPSFVSNSTVIIENYNPFRPFSNITESGLQISNLENSELTYEKKHELNLGLEAGFLDGRINVAFDWYKRNNFDLIGRTYTQGVGGELVKWANVANMTSSGVEFTLSTSNVRTKDFSWTTDFIFAHSQNKITSLKDLTRALSLVTGSGYAMQGFPVRSLFSYQFKGLNEDGVPKILSEEGVVTSDFVNFQEIDRKFHLKYEGPTDPTINGSFGNTFRYKNWHLNVFITYSGGNVVRLDPAFGATYSDLEAMPKEFLSRWTVSGNENITDIPVIADYRLLSRYTNLSTIYNAYNYSDARVAKGDFVRLKEISLTYDVPAKFAKKLKLGSMSLKLQATNLALLYSDKKLKGQDPEFINSGGVATPLPKQFTFTIRLGL